MVCVQHVEGSGIPNKVYSTFAKLLSTDHHPVGLKVDERHHFYHNLPKKPVKQHQQNPNTIKYDGLILEQGMLDGQIKEMPKKNFQRNIKGGVDMEFYNSDFDEVHKSAESKSDDSVFGDIRELQKQQTNHDIGFGFGQEHDLQGYDPHAEDKEEKKGLFGAPKKKKKKPPKKPFPIHNHNLQMYHIHEAGKYQQPGHGHQQQDHKVHHHHGHHDFGGGGDDLGAINHHLHPEEPHGHHRKELHVHHHHGDDHQHHGHHGGGDGAAGYYKSHHKVYGIPMNWNDNPFTKKAWKRMFRNLMLGIMLTH